MPDHNYGYPNHSKQHESIRSWLCWLAFNGTFKQTGYITPAA